MRRVRALLACVAMGCLAGCAVSRPVATTQPELGGIERSLSWVAEQDRGDSFRFVVLGDSQFMSDAGFASIVGQAQGRQPAMVFQVGDLIVSDRVEDPGEVHRQWAKYQSQAKSAGLKAPLFPVAGNHDSATLTAVSVWRDVWGARYYAFDFRGCHFIVLDSAVRERDIQGEPVLGKAQTEWLRRDLAAARGRNIFVFLHHPIWRMTTTRDGQEASREADWQPYHRMFVDAGVRAVFAGHTHDYSYHRVDGVDYVVTIAVKTAKPEFDAGLFPHLIQVDVAGKTVTPTVYYQGRNLPLTCVDSELQGAMLGQCAWMTPSTAPDATRADYVLHLRNPIRGSAMMSYRFDAQASDYAVSPATWTGRLAPLERVAMPVKVSAATSQPARFPRVVVPITFTRGDGRSATVERTQRLPVMPDLAGMQLSRRIGRLIVVGPETRQGMLWLAQQMKVPAVHAPQAADLERIWPTLQAGDVLVTSHQALEEDSPWAAWFVTHQAELRRFVEGGGKAVLCLGFSSTSRPLLEAFGVGYMQHTRAWSTDRKGDNGVLLVPPGGAIGEGFIGRGIVYSAIAVANGWLTLRQPADWAVLATNNLGDPIVVGRPMGRGVLVLSCARLSSHHHMQDSHNLERAWANLLLLSPESVRPPGR